MRLKQMVNCGMQLHDDYNCAILAIKCIYLTLIGIKGIAGAVETVIARRHGRFE
jgi:hypothetical protein